MDEGEDWRGGSKIREMTSQNLRILAIFDIDKTLKAGYSIIDFARYLTEIGKFNNEELSRIDVGLQQHKAGELDYNAFADLIVDAYSKGIAGQKEDELLTHSDSFWEQYSRGIYGYVEDLFRQLKEMNAETVAMSGSDKWSLAPLLSMLNFTRNFVTDYEVVEGVFTGKVVRNAASLSGKEELVKRAIGDGEYDVIFGFGDSVADLAFLRLATHAFVIGRNDQNLIAEAEEKGWVIVDDLNQNIQLASYLGVGV